MIYKVTVAIAAVACIVLAPSWLALLLGIVLALIFDAPAPPTVKRATTYVLQAGVVALGAGMNLHSVLRTGADGFLLTAVSLTFALCVGLLLGRLFFVDKETSLLIGVGTAICGGSAIAAVASVTKPKAEAMSVALGVVFVLNAVGLLLFPLLGHALHMGDVQFGRWAALAIHDTSSVVGAGMAYSNTALQVATTTKLARALWIVPLTVGIAVTQQSGNLRQVHWPWFILGFLFAAAVCTRWPQPWISEIGKRLLVLALFLIGLQLSRATLQRVGWRPFAQGVVLWMSVAIFSYVVAAR